MDDTDRCRAVLLRQRDASDCRSWLLRAGQHLLRAGRPDVLRSGCPDLLRTGDELQQLLRAALLQAQVLQDQVLQAQVLQAPLLPLELQQLLRPSADLLRSGSDLRRSDVRRSRRVLQLVC